MTKPTVYFDTSIISAYWYEGSDVALLTRRLRSREWWDLERRHFALWTSATADAELRAGTFPRQAECTAMVRRLRYLHPSTPSRRLYDAILAQAVVPPGKFADATHLALSAANGMDYLLTWNYAHMANPVVQARFDRLCAASGVTAPLMVSPESIPQVRFGQAVWREKRS